MTNLGLFLATHVNKRIKDTDANYTVVQCIKIIVFRLRQLNHQQGQAKSQIKTKK